MGPNYSISTACATANYCFNSAAMHLRKGAWREQQRTPAPSHWLGIAPHAAFLRAHLLSRPSAGDADLIIAGGVEAPIIEVGLGGFVACRALSQRNEEPAKASRPWDKGRDGFVMGARSLPGSAVAPRRARVTGRGASPVLCSVMSHHHCEPASCLAFAGEGAGVLVMETLEHAQKVRGRGRNRVPAWPVPGFPGHSRLSSDTTRNVRPCLVARALPRVRQRGATILAEYLGGAVTCDAHHLTDPREDGAGR